MIKLKPSDPFLSLVAAFDSKKLTSRSVFCYLEIFDI